MVEKNEDVLVAANPQGGHPLLQFFNYAHLPAPLRNVSEPFCIMAQDIVRNLPDNAERSTALRKLLEAKDCAVRAMLME